MVMVCVEVCKLMMIIKVSMMIQSNPMMIVVMRVKMVALMMMVAIC